MTSKHLLIITGAKNKPDLARRVSPGVRISLITRQEMWHRVWDMEKFERVIVLPDDTDEAEWLALARTIHALDPIDAIGNFTEKDLEKAAAIAADLGINWHSAEAVQAVGDKFTMRRRLQETGVDDTPCVLVTSPDELRAAAERLGYPLICKPRRGISSQGISRLVGPEDLDGAFTWSSEGTHDLDSTDLIVERFHTGDEYSVECLSEDGRHLVVSITKKSADQEHFVELGHVVPAPLDAPTRSRISDTVTRMLDALGVRDTATHTEIIVTGDAVRIVETHLRPGGDRITNMVAAVTGVDMPDAAARRYLGQSVLAAAEQAVAAYETASDKQCAAIRYAMPSTIGRVSAVEGVEAARKLPGVQEVTVMKESGSELTQLTGSGARAAFAWALGASQEEAIARAQAAVDELRFEVEALTSQS
ncbi:ATP-grasp domain-containing protein [Streptomyces sp. NRRL S-920]|uniref:ATP-grasp domain-containing protein n=1 Tax=Streptomyces sp. NRRL S-920 TaxID=1463921 RepID=UPI0004C7C2E4|nr:ATP-grasp domain-containing protein [Streptomyces sp. NRRL S-920]